MKKWYGWFWLIMLGGLLLPASGLAHEAYVLENQYFWEQINKPGNVTQALAAWQKPENVTLTLAVGGAILFLLAINFAWRQTRNGWACHQWLERYAHWGPIFVRIAVALALLSAAVDNSFLGPELPLTSLPWPATVRIALLAIGAMIAMGFLTEIAGLGALILFGLAARTFGSYLLTYVSYVGEFIGLLLFGMRRWSLDTKLLGPLSAWRAHYEKYETSIVRIFYGLGLIYASWQVKFLHPEITTKVAIDWKLTQFSWLFPSDPAMITLGAGLAELVIGLLIVIGFELRLTVLITLFYLTLSLFYFQELVWPHFILYGISLSLLVQPEVFTLDHLLFRKHRQHKRWWQRTFSAHPPHGKSVSKS
jgi:uncharacterized membrane protein YphA (DoxX/SURF4 family)